MNAVRAFVKDVGSDALAKWSGGGGLLFAFAALVFPSVFGGLRPFLLLGAACLFVSCFRAWFVAYSRTLPRFEVVNNHPERVDRFHTQQGGFASEYHRVVVRAVGIEPIEDIRVFLERFNDMDRVIDLTPAGTDGSGEVRLYHDVPRAFDLLIYNGPEDSVTLVGRRNMPQITMGRPAEPFEIIFSVAGRGVPTQRYSVMAHAGAGNVQVADAELLEVSLKRFSANVQRIA